jgi:hypothetical protein
MITDLTPYRKHVDQFDLSEEEKLELVNAVWMIVDSIFDQHLGINQLPKKEKETEKSLDCELQVAIVSKEAQSIEM